MASTTTDPTDTTTDARPPLRTGGMAPPAEALPDVLPTERLTKAGRPVAELRAPLRRIRNGRNAWTVASVWLQAIAVVVLASWIAHPLGWVVAFVFMSRVIVLCNILTHEAAHRLLFSNKTVNDFVGRWLLSYPVFVPFDVYRRAHMAHHRDAFGPNEPDLLLYANYPVPAESFRRKLVRDLFFVSGFKLLRGLFRALKSPSGRPVAIRIFATQAVLWIGFTLIGHWWVYPALWLLSWLTVWRVIARLRAIAEHGGLERADDERRVTHHVRQNLFARFWFVPYGTGWHLAHHVDPGLPFRSLPDLHRDFTAAGWVTPAYEYPNYRTLWRALATPPPSD